MTKKSILTLIICAVAFIGILLVATFFDLDINIALGNSQSLFGEFFAIFGAATSWALMPIAGVILFQAVTKENKYRNYLKALWLIFTLIGMYFTVHYFFSEMVIELVTPIVYEIFFTLVFTAISILATSKIDKDIMKKLVVFAAVTLTALALSQIFTNILKACWGRQRFRNMPEDDYTGFTNWYEPNFFKKGNGGSFISDFAGESDDDAYKSFPSGHTVSAALSFILIMLPDLFEKLKRYKIWFYVGPSIYTLAVALSRIVYRAHFLSDVLFGAVIGIGCVLLGRFLVILIKNKIVAKKNTREPKVELVE